MCGIKKFFVDKGKGSVVESVWLRIPFQKKPEGIMHIVIGNTVTGASTFKITEKGIVDNEQ